LSEKFLKGEAKGRAEGLAEGRAEGLAEGEKKGRKEQAYDIARNLISMHLPIDSIILATGLSKDEIASLG
jgi:predicted transposase YdaD